MWVFPKIMVPQHGWFIRENPIKMDDLGVHLFLETPMYFLFQPAMLVYQGTIGRLGGSRYFLNVPPQNLGRDAFCSGIS